MGYNKTTWNDLIDSSTYKNAPEDRKEVMRNTWLRQAFWVFTDEEIRDNSQLLTKWYTDKGFSLDQVRDAMKTRGYDMQKSDMLAYAKPDPVEEPGLAERMAASAIVGASRVGTTAVGALEGLARWHRIPSQLGEHAREWADKVTGGKLGIQKKADDLQLFLNHHGIPTPTQVHDGVIGTLHDWWSSLKGNEDTVNRDYNIDQDFLGNALQGNAKKAAEAVYHLGIQEIPRLGMQYVLSSIGLGDITMGLSVYNEKYNEIKEKEPEMEEWRRQGIAMLDGVIEVICEHYITEQAFKKMRVGQGGVRAVWNSTTSLGRKLVAAMTEFFGLQTKEGIEEIVTELLQDIADIAGRSVSTDGVTDSYKQFKENLRDHDWFDLLKRSVNAFVGAFVSMGPSAGRSVSKQISISNKESRASKQAINALMNVSDVDAASRANINRLMGNNPEDRMPAKYATHDQRVKAIQNLYEKGEPITLSDPTPQDRINATWFAIVNLQRAGINENTEGKDGDTYRDLAAKLQDLTGMTVEQHEEYQAMQLAAELENAGILQNQSEEDVPADDQNITQEQVIPENVTQKAELQEKYNALKNEYPALDDSSFRHSKRNDIGQLEAAVERGDQAAFEKALEKLQQPLQRWNAKHTKMAPVELVRTEEAETPAQKTPEEGSSAYAQETSKENTAPMVAEAHEIDEQKAAESKAKEEHVRKRKDIESVVKVAKSLFPKYDFRVYDTADEMPENIKAKLPKINGVIATAEAANEGGHTIHIFVDKMPSTLAEIRQRIMSHEIVGHDGLKQLLGKRYDAFLDSLVKDQERLEEIIQNNRRYNYDLETGKGRRLATEEWIAHNANLDNPPSWFQRLVSKIRATLRMMFNIDWSDNDIKVLLASASRNLSESQGGQDIKFSISNLYTGSAADYARADLSHVGTGTGTQTFSHGLYAADNINNARKYAEKDAAQKNTRKVLYKGHEYTQKSNFFFGDLNGLEGVERKALTAVVYEGSVEKALQRIDDQEVKDFLTEHRNEYSFKDAEGVEGHRHLYRQTWFTNREGEGNANLLIWNDKATPEQTAAILDSLVRQADNKAVVDYINEKRQQDGLEAQDSYTAEELRGELEKYFDGKDGQTIVSELQRLFGDAAKASQFLNKECDIDGMKYPATKREGNPGWNYVSYSDENMRIDEHIKWSLRKEAPPKKTGIGYKVFYQKDGKLYPPMIANPNAEDTPVGVWLNADAAPVVGTSKTGRMQVKQGGKGTQGGSGTLSYRPGWHLGEIPYALQFNRGEKVPNPLGMKNEKGEVIKTGRYFPKNFVWAEVEYAMDEDYQKEAESYGYDEKGKFRHSYAGLPRIPKDGYYRYRTNPNPATDPWIITGAMKVNRVLKQSEVDEIVRKAGRIPQEVEPSGNPEKDIQDKEQYIADQIGETSDPVAGMFSESVVPENTSLKFSISSARNAITETKMLDDLTSKGIMTKAEAKALKDGINGIIEKLETALKQNPLLDIDVRETFNKDGKPVRQFDPIKQNSDPLYKLSLDFSTLCKKRVFVQGVIEYLQKKLDRFMTAEEQIGIRQMLLEYKKQNDAIQVACHLCYVEAARLQAAKWQQEFIKPENRVSRMKNYLALNDKEFKKVIDKKIADYKVSHGYTANTTKKQMSSADVTEMQMLATQWRQGYKTTNKEYLKALSDIETIPNQMFLSAEGLEQLSRDYPLVYAAYTADVRSRAHAKPLETDVAYWYNDLRKVIKGKKGFEELRKMLNEEGTGFRHQSWSDFQLKHLLDTIIAVCDFSVNHLKMHAYTKRLAFARCLGKTGMMINLSLIPEMDGNGWSSVEGMDFDEAMKARDMFPDTCGTIAIAMSPEHLLRLMIDPMIDYIIPYHTSGMPTEVRGMLQLDTWKNFEPYQHEKKDTTAVEPKDHNDKWQEAPILSEWLVRDEDGYAAMEKSQRKYLDLCQERGLIPKFAGVEGLMTRDADGKWNAVKGYWKVLIDHKMVNHKTGKLIEQQIVRPVFDFGDIDKVIDEEIANDNGNNIAAAIQNIYERLFTDDVFDQSKLDDVIKKMKDKGTLDRMLDVTKKRKKTNILPMKEDDVKLSLTANQPTPVGPETDIQRADERRMLQAAAVTPIKDLNAMRLPLLLELAKKLQGNVTAVDSIPRVAHGGAIGVFRPMGRQIEVLRRLAKPQMMGKGVIVPAEKVAEQRKLWMDYWTSRGVPAKEIEITELPIGDEVQLRAMRHDRDLSEFRKVGAHEIGHLIDYNAGETTSKGNVLGTVGAMLKRHLLSVIGETPSTQIDKTRLEAMKKTLRKDAEANVSKVNPKPDANDKAAMDAWRQDVSAEYKRLFEAECDKRGWFQKDVVREEMAELTTWWSGEFDPQTNYGKYRMKPTELFAETMSVLLNAPDELMKRSPETWRMIQNYQANREDFHREWTKLMALMNDEKAYAKALLDIQREGYDAGEVEQAKPVKDNRDAFDAKETWKAAQRKFVNKFADVSAASKQLVSNGQMVFDDTPLSAITIAQHASIKDYYMKMAGRLYKPLMDMGISEKNIGVYMQNMRIVNDPSLNDTDRGILNPNGLTADDARLVLKTLKEELGDAKWDALENWHNEFWKLRQETIIQMMEDSGAYSQELIDHAKKNEWYAYRKILSTLYGEDGASTGGASAKIYGLKGTVDSAVNPLAATYENDLRIMGGILWNTARMNTVDMLKQFFPNLVSKPKVIGQMTNGRLVYADSPDGFQRMYVQRGGKIEQYDVANAFSQGFSGIVDEDMHALMGVFSKITNWWRMGWTTYSPTFFVNNVIRDYLASYQNMTWAGRPGMLQWAKYWALGMKEAFKDEFGWTSDVIDEMERLDMFQSAQVGHGDAIRKGTENERMLKKYNVLPTRTWKEITIESVKNPIKALATFMQHLVGATERGAKAGGYMAMKSLTPNMSESAMRYHVVKHIGSPDFATRGTGSFVTNTLFVFSNAAIQGWSSTLESAKANPKAYAARWMATTGMATVLGWSLSSGALLAAMKGLGFKDDDGLVKLLEWLKQMYGKITHYNRFNYMCLPIAETDDGQAVFIRIPYAENSRVPSMILNAMLESAYSKTPKSYGLPTEMARAVATMGTNLNPIFSALGDMMLFLSGYNVYDRHYGRPKVKTREFNAGGYWRAKGIARYMYREYTPFNFLKWDTENENFWYDLIGTTLGWGTLIKKSKSGEKEAAREEKQKSDSEKNRQKLSILPTK